MKTSEICHRGGIVRAPKRRNGWVPPGPEPAGPGESEDLWPEEGEDLCFLTGYWRIFQRQKGHRYSLDDLATAWYATQAVKGHTLTRAADIGCGIGSVLMMVAWSFQDLPMIGVEAQELSMGLARRSLRYNGADHRVEVRHGDLRDPDMVPEGPVFDLVTGTPPYIPVGDGVMSEKDQCAPCRFELRGGIEEYCLTAARLLAPGGRFVVCQGATQHERVVLSAQEAGLAILSWRTVVPRHGKDPLFTVFAMGKLEEHEGVEPVEEPPLVVRNAEGKWTPDYLKMRADMGMPSNT